MVAVADDERERRAERPPVAEPGEHLHLVGLDLLARRATVALLPPPQILLDPLPFEQEPGRQAGHDRDERRSVRLPGGGERQSHAERLRRRRRSGLGSRTAARMTSTGAGRPVHCSKDSAP